MIYSSAAGGRSLNPFLARDAMHLAIGIDPIFN